MSADAPSGIVLGAVLGDKYRIDRVLASGGQGTVVEATHLRLRQSVAIKFPHVDARGVERQERLFREARAAVRLHGEHVCRVIDVDLIDGAPFIVMELLRGIDLKQVMAERGEFPYEEAVGLILQACEGIAEAHDLGIVHRDLKPSNMFLVDVTEGPPLLKVLDFGISKRVSSLPASEDSDLTEPMRMMGSPRYMAPEQARDSRLADVRTDIWALGVILQELLTGRPVFRARSNADVLAMVLTKNPTPVTLVRPEVPPAIERVLLRCLQKAPEHRFPSVRELAKQLAPFAPAWAAGEVERLARPPRLMEDAPAVVAREAVADDGPTPVLSHPARWPLPPVPSLPRARGAGTTPAPTLKTRFPGETTTGVRRGRASRIAFVALGGALAVAAVGGFWKMRDDQRRARAAVTSLSRAPAGARAADAPASGPLPVIIQIPAVAAAGEPAPVVPLSPVLSPASVAPVATAPGSAVVVALTPPPPPATPESSAASAPAAVPAPTSSPPPLSSQRSDRGLRRGSSSRETGGHPASRRRTRAEPRAARRSPQGPAVDSGRAPRAKDAAPVEARVVALPAADAENPLDARK